MPERDCVLRIARAGALPLGWTVLLAGCLSGGPVGGGPGQSGQPVALGSFAVTSATLGDATLAPTSCTAGDRQLFLGADFASESNGLVLRLVVDPIEGPAVRLYAAGEPFDRSVVFHRSECGIFHFSLDSTGWRVNDVNDYRLTLELDCSRPGESLKGSASTTHCH